MSYYAMNVMVRIAFRLKYCTNPEVSDKKLYPTFARTMPHDSQISMAVVSLLRKFQWNKVVFIYSDRRLLLAEAIKSVS